MEKSVRERWYRICRGEGVSEKDCGLTAFDRPYLQAAAPDLRLLGLLDVDTLKLNPLAFPRNPYHHLVKHYQDGALRRGHRNDPEQDVRLTMSLFADQRAALFACHEEAPRRVLAWHFPTTGDVHAGGLHALFASIRRRPRPTVDETREAIACRCNCGKDG